MLLTLDQSPPAACLTTIGFNAAAQYRSQGD